jgi:arylsulfatase A-like enzyme
VPGLLSYPDKIPGGQVIDTPVASMDIFPTVLTAAGGSPDDYEIDGVDIMPLVTGGTAAPHDMIFWEFQKQTAVRKGDYKLVLDGKLLDNGPDTIPVFLSNLADDPSESVNLADSMPELTAELSEAAKKWRAGVEDMWKEKFAANYQLT